MFMKLDNPDFKRIEVLVKTAWWLTHPARKEAPLCSDLHKIFETIEFLIIKLEQEGSD